MKLSMPFTLAIAALSIDAFAHEMNGKVFVGDDPVTLLTVHADTDTIRHREAVSTIWVEKNWGEEQSTPEKDDKDGFNYDRTRSRYAFACEKSLRIESEIWYYLDGKQVERKSNLKDLRDTGKMYPMDSATDAENTLSIFVCDGVFEPVQPSPALSDKDRKVAKLQRHIDHLDRYALFLEQQAFTDRKDDAESQKWFEKWMKVNSEIEGATEELTRLQAE